MCIGVNADNLLVITDCGESRVRKWTRLLQEIGIGIALVSNIFQRIRAQNERNCMIF